MSKSENTKPYVFPEREIIDRMVGWYHGNYQEYKAIKTVTEMRRYKEDSDLHELALNFISSFFEGSKCEAKLHNEKKGYFQHFYLGEWIDSAKKSHNIMFIIETTHSSVNTPRAIACTITIAGANLYVVRNALKDASTKFHALTNEIEPEKDEGLKISFINWDGNRGAIADQIFTLPESPWEEIALNYNEEVRLGVEKALSFTPDTLPRGKLMMWYGVPGTGKTWAIRALAKGWSEWADFNYVIDPEALFHSASYLQQAFLVDHKKNGKARWRVLVLEDCERYFTANKGTITEDFSRVLNVTDGVMAELSRTIILSTSNTKLDDFHAAITRPGRCLHQLEFTPHNTESANAWLRAHDVKTTVTNSSTLAELYGIVNDYKPLQNAEKVVHTGAYI